MAALYICIRWMWLHILTQPAKHHSPPPPPNTGCLFVMMEGEESRGVCMHVSECVRPGCRTRSPQGELKARAGSGRGFCRDSLDIELENILIRLRQR